MKEPLAICGKRFFHFKKKERTMSVRKLNLVHMYTYQIILQRYPTRIRKNNNLEYKNEETKTRKKYWRLI